MKWIKQPSNDYRRAAILALDDAAEVTFGRSRQYAGDEETHGFIAEGVLPLLVRRYTPARARKITAALVQVGLWEAREQDGLTGWYIVGWAEEQVDMETLIDRRVKEAARQKKHRDRKRTPGQILALREAMDDAGVTTSWARLTAEQTIEIELAMEQHGIPALVAAAQREYRPDDPARSAVAFLKTWADLRAPRAKPTRAQWCGDCDERTRLTNDDHPRRCPACGTHSSPAPDLLTPSLN